MCHLLASPRQQVGVMPADRHRTTGASPRPAEVGVSWWIDVAVGRTIMRGLDRGRPEGAPWKSMPPDMTDLLEQTWIWNTDISNLEVEVIGGSLHGRASQ